MNTRTTLIKLNLYWFLVNEMFLRIYLIDILSLTDDNSTDIHLVIQDCVPSCQVCNVMGVTCLLILNSVQFLDSGRGDKSKKSTDKKYSKKRYQTREWCDTWEWLLAYKW